MNLRELPVITVWVCENCGSFYAATNAGNLDEKMTTAKYEAPYKRSRCPTPDCAKQNIHRQPVQYAAVRTVYGESITTTEDARRQDNS